MGRVRHATGVGVAAALAWCGSAEADLLGLPIVDFPDIASGFIDVTYDAGTDLFVADGVAIKFDNDGAFPNEPIVSGSFSLNATIDATGAPMGGSLSIGGSVLSFGPTLLTGSMLDFGFVSTGGKILEFLFEVTGGDLASDYGGIGGLFGVVMDTGGAGYSGDFGTSFDNLVNGIPGSGSGVANTAPIPAPAALALLAIGGAAGRRRRRRTG